MLSWFGTKSGKTKPIQGDWPLKEAIDVAIQVWKNAQNRVSISETDDEIDDAILHLQLTEKRYVYLLKQARYECQEKQVLG
jgi:Protein of unknown function (DUF2508)